ncbi:MAG: hypothetical protein QGH72_04730, partial [Dehalococcoidia bacterium]|nr:hypothetical protein [Dehalococcoidia bacterium]
EDSVQTDTVNENGVYKKVVLREGRLVGFLLQGDIDQAGVLFRLMRDRVPVVDFQDRLLEDGFGLVSLPRPLRDAWLGDGGMGYEGSLAGGLAAK